MHSLTYNIRDEKLLLKIGESFKIKELIISEWIDPALISITVETLTIKDRFGGKFK